MDIPLVNIANYKRNIYLFLRDEKGNQNIEKINDFFPFFYEPCDKQNAKYISYDGVPLKKVFASEPQEIPKMRSLFSYSSDIRFPVNFIINRVDNFIKCSIKYFFIDIEILADEMPETKEAKYPVSCISIYNSFSKEIKTWWLGDYGNSEVTAIGNENIMLEDFIKYIKQEKPDIWLSWNVKFDYNYLYHRISDFPQKISPVNFARMGEEKDIFYPAGISVVDYLRYYKKIEMREASYALDYIAQKRLNEKSWSKTNFSKLNIKIKEKNINDINRMIKLEEKYHIIPYFDEIRRLTKCQWEDLYHNSRVSEMLLLAEAKKKGVILPNKPKINDNEEETTFQGATREAEKDGLYENIGKFDLSSAYPSMIVNFCLDPHNIVTDGVDFEMYGGTKINTSYFRQNRDTLLPTIVKQIMVIKDVLKKEKKENPYDKTLQTKYDAIKAVVNSLFGVMGNRYYRIYNNEVASAITFLVRDVLMYVKEQIEKSGLKVIYWDTDSVFVNTIENISDKLNQYIKDWALNRYDKKEIDLSFEYEGYFEKLFIIGKCHYYGRVHGKKEPEIKGIEAKRSSSSKYEAWFQEELLNKILNGETKDDILKWIYQEEQRIQTLPLEEISFPAKISSNNYKVYTIFQRAYDNTQKIRKDFKLNKGELFYYIFTKDDVLAFLDNDKDFINRNQVDWKQTINRNIFNKTDKIFKAMNWVMQDPNQSLLM